MARSDARGAVRDAQVMILAGGAGERLYPLTKERAKPAVPFAGSYRLIDFTLSNCLNSGLRRIYVLTQYKSESLDRHIRHGWNVFNPEIGEWIETRPPQQRMSSDWYIGTADAIYQNIYTLEHERPPHVLILSGDHLYRMDYSLLLDAHLERDADLTVACIESPTHEAAGKLGVVTVNSEMRINRLEEKPDEPSPTGSAPDACLCSMGIYAFKTETLVRRVIEDAKHDTTHDFGRDVIPAMVADGDAVYAFPFSGGYWRDIGDLDTYWDAHMDLISVQPAFNLYDAAWPVRGFPHCHAPAKIVFGGGAPEAPKAQVYNSLICDGAIVSGAYVCDSVIGPGVRVEVGSRVEQSVILDGTTLGRDVTVNRAVIDKANHLPDGARVGVDLEWDRRHFSVTDSGLVVIGKAMPFPSP